MKKSENIIIDKILSILKIKVSKEKRELLIQVVNFLIVGGIATIIDWLLYYVFYNYIKLSPLLANIISYTISTLYSYIVSVKYVFNVNKDNSKKKNFIIFVLLSIIGLLLSEGLIYLMVNIFNIHKMLAKVISTVIVMFFNFVSKKYFLEK